MRYVGDPVAAVADRALRWRDDALALIEVDYEPLPAVVDPEKALQAGAPLLYEEFGTNPATHSYQTQRRRGSTAFAAADKVVKLRVVNQRLFPVAMETRCAAAEYRRRDRRAHVWASTQIPHGVKTKLSRAARAAREQGARDRAGGRRRLRQQGRRRARGGADRRSRRCELGRPVKWIETRRENFQAAMHGRGQIDIVEAAVKNDGTITGLKVTRDLPTSAPTTSTSRR